MAPTRCCGEANTLLIEFGWEFRVPEPGFARVDPLRGRVSGLLQERESETIDHERSGKIQALRCLSKRGSSNLHQLSKVLNVVGLIS